MKAKTNLTDKMKRKISALACSTNSTITIKNHREMAACYRAAEILGVSIARQVNLRGGGWTVYRIS